MNKDNKHLAFHASSKEVTLETRILQSIRRVVRAMDIHSKELVSQHNITAPQLLTLADIAENNRTTITELTKRIYLDASTLVGIIDRLETKGFVRRERDKHDRRQIHIYISDKGRDFIEKTPNLSQSLLLKALHHLGGQEKQHFSDTLDKVINYLEKERS